jgi:hypothetical protein
MSQATSLLASHAGIFLGFFSDAEDEANIFLRNVGWLSLNNAAF